MNPFRSASVLVAAAALVAQAPTPPAPAPAPARPLPDPGHCIEVRYPRDRDRAVAMVDGLPITLGDLCRHIDERHYPGFRQFLAGPEDRGTPDGARILSSDLVAPWVRQFADVTALQAEGKARGFEPKAAEEAIAAALKAGFEEFLQHYVEDLQRRGLPTELGKTRMDRLLADYQLRNGLACELQGWLDFLEPQRDWTDQQLSDFFQADPRIFGGALTIAHILIQHRDAGTGLLLTDEGRGRALARLTEVQARLAKDGRNFEELARLYSEDAKTAADGGMLRNVERFDQRLPAALCRAAWELADGKVSGVIETQYGWHLLKRIELVQQKFMLFTPGAYPVVRLLKKKTAQENLLFLARARHKIELKL